LRSASQFSKSARATRFKLLPSCGAAAAPGSSVSAGICGAPSAAAGAAAAGLAFLKYFWAWLRIWAVVRVVMRSATFFHSRP